ncbi:MAG: hypothetical protein WA130_14380 [Candidatus Methanoperedens sp.]
MVEYLRALKYPVITTIVVAIVFVAVSYVTGVLNMLTAAVLAPVALAIGVWAGYKIVEFKGNYADVIGAGVIVGIVGAVAILTGFGVVRGLGVNAMLAVSVFDLGFKIAGALVGGGGFALTK